jgi:hypothetical protein
MATVVKRNAHKMFAGGKPNIFYADLNYPGLSERKHITITIGDAIIRIELSEAKRVANEILAAIKEHA